MKCPNCKRKGIRKIVSVIVETDAENYSLNKKGIRRRNVLIQGVNWPGERMFCPKCKYVEPYKQ